MRSAILLSVGWIAVSGLLYFSVVLLDVYWNLSDWKPKSDWETLVLLAGLACALLGTSALIRRSSRGLVFGFAAFLCILLAAAGLYACTAEPLSDGLFRRTEPSPLWYRTTRIFVLALPGILLAIARYKRKPASATGAHGFRS